jgi:hypothetical protein
MGNTDVGTQGEFKGVMSWCVLSSSNDGTFIVTETYGTLQ